MTQAQAEQIEQQEQTMFDDGPEQAEAIETTAIQKHEPALPTLDPESLIAKAIEHQVPVDSLERLLDLRERIKNEKAREAFHAALAAFQSECPIITKTRVIPDNQGRERSRYAPLEAIVTEIKPLLLQHGLSYSFDSEIAATEGSAVKAICTIHHTAGHSESSSFTAHIDTQARMNTPQRDASAQTYAKRYAFMNALGILTAGEDDDGRGAGATPGAKPEQHQDAPSAPTRKQRQHGDERRERVQKAYNAWLADHKGQKFEAFAGWAAEVASVPYDALQQPTGWTDEVMDTIERTLSKVAE